MSESGPTKVANVSSLYLVDDRADRLRDGRRAAARLLGGGERDRELAERGVHPDLVELTPADGKERIGIDQVRVVVRAAQFAPVQADRKVCLVPRAEALTPEAANALLKVMEEPPRGFLFVLLAGHPSDLLPTIVSRSRIVRARPDAARGVESSGGRAAGLRGLARDESEWAEWRDAPMEAERAARAAEAAVGELDAAGVAERSIAGSLPERRAALSEWMARATRRDSGMLTVGVRFVGEQSRETILRFLRELLAVASDQARATHLPLPEEGPVSRICERMLCAFCGAIESAYAAMQAHGPTDAILLSLFLSMRGGDERA